MKNLQKSGNLPTPAASYRIVGKLLCWGLAVQEELRAVIWCRYMGHFLQAGGMPEICRDPLGLKPEQKVFALSFTPSCP